MYWCMTLIYRRNSEISNGIVFPSNMYRVALAVEYCGAKYYGFQKQTTTMNTIQYHLEKALSKVSSEKITLICAGRTDSGVHASEQIIHFDTLAKRPVHAWVKGVNAHLPDDIRIHWAKDVDYSFHSRFGALSRTYRYVIYANEIRPGILHERVSWVGQSLNIEKMKSACQSLIGRHDFTSFRASRCQASNAIREIYDLKIFESGPFIVMEVVANAFLLHMVRNIAGVMIDIGKEKQDFRWVQSLLDAKDRTKAGMTASPFGLYFVKVSYDAKYKLPQSPLGPMIVY